MNAQNENYWRRYIVRFHAGHSPYSEEWLTLEMFIKNKNHTSRIIPLIAICGCIYLSSAYGEEYFNPSALEIEGQNNVNNIDLSYFNDSNKMAPGQYRVSVYLNESLIDVRDVYFDVNAEGVLYPKLTVRDYLELGVKAESFLGENKLSSDEVVKDIGEYIIHASTKLNIQKLQLDISIPQASIVHQSQGYVDSKLWDQGISALLLNYSITGERAEYKHGRGRSDSFYANLQSGLNIGAWRIRNYSTYSKTDINYADDSQQVNFDAYKINSNLASSEFNSVNTYMQRDIQALKSQLTLGDSYTPSDIFDSVQFRGVQLSSDDNMLPDSMRGFAPTIRGIARTNAKVTVSQNGYIIYQDYVSPGAFIIQDLYPTSASGNLLVTITEADGSERTFAQPFSAVPIMQREGNYKYEVTAGKYRSLYQNKSEPKFVQGTITYGFPHNLTVYSGVIGAENYRSYLFGLGFGFGELGSISLDATNADSELFNDQRSLGQSYRVQYSKGMQSTGTTFTLAAYRYSTKGYYTFQEVNEIGTSNESSPILLNNKRQKLQVNLSQSLGGYGSLYFSGSHQNYWGLNGYERSLSSGYNFTYAGISYGISYTYSNGVSDEQPDQRMSFNMQVPLSMFSNSHNYDTSWVSYNATTDIHGKVLQQASLNGAALKDNRLNYLVQQSYGNHQQGNSGRIAMDYKGSKGAVNVGYYYDNDSNRINYGVRGGIIAYRDGLVFGQQLGDSMAIVEVPGAENVSIQNQTGVETDSRGYAIVPYVNNYKSNRIALDTTTLGSNVDVDMQTQTVYPTKGAVVLAKFDSKIGHRVLMKLSHAGDVIPFGAIVQQANNTRNIAVVGDDGLVYLTGLSNSGRLNVSWGYGHEKTCHVDYRFDDDSNASIIKEVALCH
ncbi:fimbria/pilus outer membrane usher protein [Aeromonas dhakensis]|uniref:fimbria/pilus outer membrane usher protein n=1 Tax=Aeromonas dhakensis TaxID=196024 RepID=UPI003F78F28F